MDLDSNNFTKSVWIDMELSQPDKELIDVSELYLTKIYPSLVSANEIMCKVRFPEYVSDGWFGYKSHYEYEIISSFEIVEISVKRRYKDIEALHTILTASYPGFTIPPLPVKSVLKYHDKYLLSQRRTHIEFYLNYIGMHFILKNSEALKSFLTDKKFNNGSELKLSSYIWPVEDVFEKKLTELLVRVDVIFGKRNVVIDEKYGKIFGKLKRKEESLEFLSNALGNWEKSYNDKVGILDSVRYPGFCEWTFDIVKLETGYAQRIANHAFEINKELLTTKGLISSIHCLQHYQLKSMQIQKIMDRKMSKITDKTQKIDNELKTLQRYSYKLNELISSIQENIEKEHSIYKKNFKEKFSDSLVNMIKRSQFFYQESSIFLLNIKHSVN